MDKDIEQRLAEIEAREKAATDGPWESNWRQGMVVANGEFVMRADSRNCCEVPSTIEGRKEDEDFVAHSREDIPWLAVQLREALAEIERMKAEQEDQRMERDLQ